MACADAQRALRGAAPPPAGHTGRQHHRLSVLCWGLWHGGGQAWFPPLHASCTGWRLLDALCGCPPGEGPREVLPSARRHVQTATAISNAFQGAAGSPPGGGGQWGRQWQILRASFPAAAGAGLYWLGHRPRPASRPMCVPMHAPSLPGTRIHKATAHLRSKHLHPANALPAHQDAHGLLQLGPSLWP